MRRWGARGHAAGVTPRDGGALRATGQRPERQATDRDERPEDPTPHGLLQREVAGGIRQSSTQRRGVLMRGRSRTGGCAIE